VLQSLKRPVSPSKELESTLAKKLKTSCRPEIDLDTSQVFDLTVAKEVDMLEHAGIYAPLGLFTREAIDFIAFNANSLKTIRTTVAVDGKAVLVRVIDADHKRIPKEHLLPHRDWHSTSLNHVIWAEKIKKGDV
jgi:hypothetical protein